MWTATFEFKPYNYFLPRNELMYAIHVAAVPRIRTYVHMYISAKSPGVLFEILWNH